MKLPRLGCVLPTAGSLAIEERSYRRDLLRRREAVEKMGLEKLRAEVCQMEEYTRYFLPDGTWLEMGMDCRCRRFHAKGNDIYALGFVSGLESVT